jgi:hypothetical protein
MKNKKVYYCAYEDENLLLAILNGTLRRAAAPLAHRLKREGFIRYENFRPYEPFSIPGLRYESCWFHPSENGKIALIVSIETEHPFLLIPT